VSIVQGKSPAAAANARSPRRELVQVDLDHQTIYYCKCTWNCLMIKAGGACWRQRAGNHQTYQSINQSINQPINQSFISGNKARKTNKH